jgi:hypothetical protein
MTARDIWRQSFGRLPLGTEWIAGIHWGEDSAVMIQIRCQLGSAFILEKASTLPWSGLSLHERAQMLKERWKMEGFEPQKLVATFPQRLAIVKTLNLPATQPHELHEMVKLQAARQLPLQEEELEVRSRVLSRTADGYSSVMMILARRTDILRHLEVLEEAGLHPDRLVLDSAASLSLIRRASEAGPALSINVGAQEALLGLFSGPYLRTLRSLPLPVDSGSWPSILRMEAAKTALLLDTSSHSAALPVYVGGDPSRRLTALGALNNEANFRVHSVDSSDRITRNPQCPVDSSFGLWAALGAVIIDDAASQNLMPPLGKKRRGRPWESRVAAFLSLLLMALGASTLMHRFYERQELLSRLSMEARALASETKELRQMQKQTRLIHEQMGKKGSLLYVVSDLNRIMPAHVSVESLTFERDRTLQIQGLSKTFPEALRLVQELQKSSLYSKVELTSSNTRRQHDEDVIDFQLTGQLGGGPR